jgi:hypothetical protein
MRSRISRLVHGVRVGLLATILGLTLLLSAAVTRQTVQASAEVLEPNCAGLDCNGASDCGSLCFCNTPSSECIANC